jgi:hypothetical protein
VRNSTHVLLYSTWWRTQLITLLEDIHDDMDLCKNLLFSFYQPCCNSRDKCLSRP